MRGPSDLPEHLHEPASEAVVFVEVKDTGPGLSSDEKKRVFHPYYRKESDRDHLSGLGLGLAICKKIIDLHNGKIWVKNRRGKKGSVFGFSIFMNGS